MNRVPPDTAFSWKLTVFRVPNQQVDWGVTVYIFLTCCPYFLSMGYSWKQRGKYHLAFCVPLFIYKWLWALAFCFVQENIPMKTVVPTSA
jgi:hypothetical protein